MSENLKAGYIILTHKGVAHHTEMPFYDGWHKPLAKTFCGIRYRSSLRGGQPGTEKPEARICKACLRSTAFRLHFPEQARPRGTGR